MASPYDDGWLDMRDVELQLNDPRTKSLIASKMREYIPNPFTGVSEGSFVESYYNKDGDLFMSGVAIPYKRK